MLITHSRSLFLSQKKKKKKKKGRKEKPTERLSLHLPLQFKLNEICWWADSQSKRKKQLQNLLAHIFEFLEPISKQINMCQIWLNFDFVPCYNIPIQHCGCLFPIFQMRILSTHIYFVRIEKLSTIWKRTKMNNNDKVRIRTRDRQLLCAIWCNGMRKRRSFSI